MGKPDPPAPAPLSDEEYRRVTRRRPLPVTPHPDDHLPPAGGDVDPETFLARRER